MKYYAYYPGCTLYTTGRDLDACARKAAQKVGFELKEMGSWVCCGAVYNTSADDFAGRIGAVRNLVRASGEGDKLVTLCAACYNVLKRAKARLDDPANAEERRRVLDFLDEKTGNGLAHNTTQAQPGLGHNPNLHPHPLPPPTRGREQKGGGAESGSCPAPALPEVVHYLEVLKKDVGFEQVKDRVTRPLAGLKTASYYGCLMVRPPDVLDFDDPEDPQVMDDLMRALGAEPTLFDFKAECCGGYLVVNRKEVARDASLRVLENARSWGAEAIVTTCPLCQYNLDRAQTGLAESPPQITQITQNTLTLSLPLKGEGIEGRGKSVKSADSSAPPIPVLYFTQLLGLAVGLAEDELGFGHNTVDPRPLLKSKGLL